MRASYCDFLVKDGFEAVGKLAVGDNTENKTTWRYTNFVTGKVTRGFIETDGKNYKLVKDNNKKTFGTLINFSLLNFDPRIRYSLISGKHPFFCEVDDYTAGAVPGKSLAYYFPIGQS